MKFLLLLITFFSIANAAAQSTVSGVVHDAETGEPLAGASVFAQNTTKGTATDKDGKFSLYLPQGGYEIIISYTGYTSKTINLDLQGDREFNIRLEKGDNALAEVVIKNSNEVPDGWEKYGDFFIKHFIGATPYAVHTTLLNPEALKFYYYKKSDRLKVLATEPLRIQNHSLGYNIRYELDSFVHHFSNTVTSYRGYSFYAHIDSSWQQLQQWKENRNKIYYGSRLHFLRSYYDSTLAKEGFTVDIFSKASATKFARLRNPYDTSYYFFNENSKLAELWFPERVSISYIKKAPEKEYLEQYKLPLDVRIQISYVDFLDAILINSNGYYSDQKSLVNQGYWSWKNIADQLPYDFEPEQ